MPASSLERAREQVQRDKDKAAGMSPDEYRHAIWDRRLERNREKNYEDFERFCANEVAGALAEYGPDGVALDAIREGVEWSLPQHDEALQEVAEWFAGPMCAALVEAARKVAPEPADGPPEQALARKVDDLGSENEPVEPFRVMPPRPAAEPIEAAQPAVETAPKPAVEDEVPEMPPVADHVAHAARRLSIQIWSTEMMPRARLSPSNDQALAHAQSQGWLTVDAKDRIVQGGIDPRPVTVTRIPTW